jgi:hypothetical protein
MTFRASRILYDTASPRRAELNWLQKHTVPGQNDDLGAALDREGFVVGKGLRMSGGVHSHVQVINAPCLLDYKRHFVTVTTTSLFSFLPSTMGDFKPSPNSSQTRIDNYGDPFADRPRQTHFTEPERPYGSSSSTRAFESTASLPQDLNGGFDDEDEVEKLPLNTGGNFTGGFYPPGYVIDDPRLPLYSPDMSAAVQRIPLLMVIIIPRLVDLAPSFLHLPTVLIMHGDGVKPSSVVLRAKSSSPTVISSLSTQSRHPSSMPWKKSGRRPTKQNSRKWHLPFNDHSIIYSCTVT